MHIDVSIILCAYNAEEHIIKSIESVLNQTGVSLELILVDDGSTDGTLGIMHRFASQDPRIKVVHNKMNLGLCCSRNLGVLECEGEWITILDADDWYAEGRLARLMEAGLCQGVEMVADNQFLVWSGSPKRNKTLFANRFQGADTIISMSEFVRETRPSPLQMSIGYIKPLIRKDFLLTHNLNHNEKLTQFVDWELWMRCLLHGAKLLLINTPGYYYTVDVPDSVSKKNDEREQIASMLATTESMIELAQQQQNDEAMPQLLIRKRLFLRLEKYRCLRLALKSWRLHEALGYIWREPGAIPLFTFFAAAGFWNRLYGKAKR